MSKLEDKVKGTIFGLAVGDAFGAPFEFDSRRTIQKKYNGKVKVFVNDPGVFGPNGDWTDDTDMALCIIDAIIEDKDINQKTVGKKFLEWYHSMPPDIGMLTRTVMGKANNGMDWEKAAFKVWCEFGKRICASNGSLMRCAPIGVFEYESIGRSAFNSELISKMTHYDIRCINSTIVLNYIIGQNMQKTENDKPPIKYATNDLNKCKELLRKPFTSTTKLLEQLISDIQEFELGKKSFEEISKPYYDKGGYVLSALAIALISFYCTDSYRQALIESVNFGGDNDTNGAICGALSGSFYGYSKIPLEWINRLNRKEFLMQKSEMFYRVIKWKAKPSELIR